MTKEDEIIDPRLPETSNDPTVTFALDMPGATPATRGMSENDECDVQTIDVLLFNNDGSNNRVYYGHVVGGELQNTPGNTKQFTARIPVGDYSNFDITIIANGRAQLAAAGLVPGEAKLAALGKLMYNMPNDTKWTAVIPMWGEAVNVTVDAATNLSGSNAVKMTRMVARIDVKLSKQAASGSANPSDPWNNSNFKLQSVRLYNYNTKGTIAPDLATGWDATQTKATAPHQPTSGWGQMLYNAHQPLEYGAADQHSSAQFLPDSLVRAIYTLEAPKGSASTLATNTCLVIGGSYQNGTETFYRVDFAVKNQQSQQWDYLNLLRNHQYIVNINKISGAGFDTPDKAFNSAPVNIEAGILEWNEADMGTIIFDGQDYLALDPSEFVVDKLAGSSRLTARTSVKNWTLRVCDANGDPLPLTDKWLKIDGTETVDVATSNIDVYFNIEYTENTSGNERVAYVFIEAGRLTYKVKVTQSNKIELKITITDENDNPIPGNRLDFMPAGETKYFKVTWTPADRPLTISKSMMGSEQFVWQHADNNITSLPGQTTPKGTKTFTVDPVALSGVFNSRGSVLSFAVSDEENVETQSEVLTLYQGNKFKSVTPGLFAPSTRIYNVSGNGPYSILIESFADAVLEDDTVITQMGVPWRASFSTDAGATWSDTPPAWLAGFPTYGNGSAAGETFTHNSAPAIVSAVSSDQHVTEDLMALTVPASGPGSTKALAKDLTDGTHSANCYVVNGPGWYKFPLYYGNMRNNPSGQHINVGYSYLDYNGDAITDAPMSRVVYAKLVWQDSPNLVTQIEATGGTNDIVWGWSREWVTFYVAPETISQGNASIAVTNNQQNVMWSWHIWVTSPTIWDAENPQTVAVANKAVAPAAPSLSYTVPVQTNQFAFNNLGYKTTQSKTLTANEPVLVRIDQIGVPNAATHTITVSQDSSVQTQIEGNPYWQWGRFAPLPSSDGTANEQIQWGATFGTGSGNGIRSLGSQTLQTSVQFPDALFLGGQGYTWIGGLDPSHLWNAATPGNIYNATSYGDAVVGFSSTDIVKSVYDPCPIGFEVPPPAAFTGFSKGTGASILQGSLTTYANGTPSGTAGGYNFYTQPNGGGSTLYFPASGIIDVFAGNNPSVTLTNTHKNWWAVYHSALPTSQFPIGFSFLSDLKYLRVLSSSYSKTDAASIRPVAE